MDHFWGHQLFPGAHPGTDRSNDKWTSYDQSPKYPGPASNDNCYYYQQRRRQHTTEWDRPGSSTQNWHNIDPETEEDPDGLPYEADEDSEFARKHKEWDRPSSPTQNWHSADPETEEDRDGLPYEAEEDPELTRKRKELQVIEEQIMLKRASLALKTVDVKTYKSVLCTEESKAIETSETLRERVKCILQLRKCVFGTNGPVATSKRHSLTVQHQHPLKQRVAAALQQRFFRPPVEPQKCEPVPFVNTPVPRDKDLSPVKKEAHESNQGFMRFLSILNKGVDIDKLKEIVNDETGSVPHSSQNSNEIHSATNSFKSPPIEKKQLEEELCPGAIISFESSPVERIERKKLEEDDQRPNTDEPQKHLQNILESLGLSLGTDEINRLGDRTQERLYGKKQGTESKEKKQTEQQEKGEEKYSPGHYTRSSSSGSSSSLSRSSSRTPSPLRRRRSPSPACSRRQRSSWSPRRRRHSHSPYRRRGDSRSPHQHKSSHPGDHLNSQFKYLPQMPPYVYPPTQYYDPHFPPQMPPNAYCYSQYTAYYNYWAHNQAPVPGSVGLIDQNCPQNIPPLLSTLQSDQHKSVCVQEPPTETNSISSESLAEIEDLQNLSNNNTARCLVTVNQMTIGKYRKMSRYQKSQRNRENKAQAKWRRKMRTLSAGEEIKNWRIELTGVIEDIKKAKDSKCGETAGASVAQGTSGMQQNPRAIAGPKKKKKKAKKKKLDLIDRNEQIEKLVTRALGLTSPPKYERKLMEIKVAGDPSQELREDIPENVPEAEERKPKLTEEEIKANLKKTLAAFNSRMKKNITQPAGLLMPQSVEDEI